MKENKDAYITYKDEKDETQEGWFDIVEKNSGYITFLTGRNKITIPMNRILRVKERGDSVE